MVGYKNSRGLLDRIKTKIESKNFMSSNRISDKDFTRKRKMPFCLLIYFMLNSVKQTLQKELTNFISSFSNYNDITKSAFCQHRLKLKPEAFIELNDTLINEFYTDNFIETWQGFRLLSIDGSTLELPGSSALIEEFGVNNESNKIPIAKISSLFDLLNKMILDTTIAPNCSSEYDLAVQHLDKLKLGDLLILDRGYPAHWLFYILLRRKTDFLVRLPREFSNESDKFWNSKETSKIIEVIELSYKSKQKLNDLNIPFQAFKYRFVKVILDNGEIEVLATSLLDENKYPVKIFKALYYQRWGIEVNIAHLKNHIEIGNFTGVSTQVIRQDFFANAFIANIQQILIRDAQVELNNKISERKYEYKINRNLSLGYMKDRLIEILTSKDPSYHTQIVRLFQREPVPIRPNRTYPREKNRGKRKYYLNQKRAL